VHLGSVRSTEAVVHRALTDFAERAQRSGLRSFAHGLGSLSMCAASIGAGFHMIDGPLVGEPTAAPTPVRRFTMADLYAQALEEVEEEEGPDQPFTSNQGGQR